MSDTTTMTHLNKVRKERDDNIRSEVVESLNDMIGIAVSNGATSKMLESMGEYIIRATNKKYVEYDK